MSVTNPAPFDPVPILADELALPISSVSAAVKLLAEGATVPFIARYRKEATGGLDEVQLRAIEERRTYLVELAERRASVIEEISKQGKLTPALEAKLKSAKTKAEVEDLYLPYKPKRRTRAMIAKERGLEPLAELLWKQGSTDDPQTLAARFVDAGKEVPDVAAALAGARDIVAERVADTAEVRKHVRDTMAKDGVLKVEKTKEFADKPTKFDTYATYEEPVANMPSHRVLAIRRGETENVLRANLTVDAPKLVGDIGQKAGATPKGPWAGEMEKAVGDAYKRLLAPTCEVDVRVELKMRADREAVTVFAQNLRELLLAAPYGTKTVLGIDPGQRTGCKCVVLDPTGKLLENATIYIVQGDSALDKARATLKAMLAKHDIRAIAVGNGTHGRETESFVRDVLKDTEKKDVLCIPVSEAGASVYSASDVAREEFPELDLTVRGAISIARRLQDPLAELVKIDPKSIGVGQYQHDVSAVLLEKKLDEVVESCVNLVGVELNTASAPLLSRVSGIGPTLAKRIVAHRNDKGAFGSRKALLDVAGVGPRTFEQCAGFLRVQGGEHPLDASAVHPERYELVEKIAKDLGVAVHKLVGDADLIGKIDARKYATGDVGEFTLNDIVAELKKPGRDPRKNFEPPAFRDDVRTLEDLKEGMVLEGVVTNVTAFGAFVDIGVHQDGLVHVSELADRFVKDPAEVAKVGDKVKVRVLEVDLTRKRIRLSAKSGAPRVGGSPQQGQQHGQAGNNPNNQRRPPVRGDKPKTSAPAQPQKQFSYNPFEKLLRK
ncbi:MAG: RNA-binding transcriptional accessory protein [Polyangiaceae bacterium]|nr:RNA-binding transcriptional accessory protein [Polyangiaceae bacterium]